MTTDLEADLAEELGYSDPPGSPCPPPEDAEQASKMLRTLRYLQRRMDEVEALHTAEVVELGRWRNKTLEPLANRYARTDEALAAWGRAVNAADASRKTINLPHGKVEVRPRQPKVEATKDQAQLGVLAKAHPGWVRAGKLEAALTPIKTDTVAGPPLDPQPEGIEDGYRAHAAVRPGDAAEGIEDELIPHVVWLVPSEKKVTVKPGGPE